MDIIEVIKANILLKKYTLYVTPMGKPRMVNSDKWRKRDVTTRYWKLKDALKAQASKCQLSELPDDIPLIIFYMPIPKSKIRKPGSKAKGKVDENDPVKVKPDVDNLIKALFDCLAKEDSYIHTFATAKRYSQNPRIEIYLRNQ